MSHMLSCSLYAKFISGNSRRKSSWFKQVHDMIQTSWSKQIHSNKLIQTNSFKQVHSNKLIQTSSFKRVHSNKSMTLFRPVLTSSSRRATPGLTWPIATLSGQLQVCDATLSYDWNEQLWNLNSTLLLYGPRCNTLQHTAIHCNTLQYTATHCNTQ